jgi:xylan 1,4-beta-xylosidase
MLKAILISGVFMSLSPAILAADAPDTSTWARFSSFRYDGKTTAEPGAGEYLNPIIAGFYPDPSICRVDDDYYLVNSAFNYFPSIPIWHSKDLVNWTQIGNIIDRPSQFAIRGGAVQSGTYAPTIRYYEGTYYVVCTLVGGIGNFYVTAEDPKGPWSEPIRLPDVGGIDPSFFFDDDGKCYITNCDEPVGPAQYSGHRTIRIQEVDLEKQTTVGEKTVLVNGGTDISQRPNWCEGPHLYKIDGIYYLMCAQGGTGTAHTEVIFKSDALLGPYIPWDKNPILSAMGLPENRPDPVTCTGHADLVQTQHGDWYAVFLACQPYDRGFYNTGRQTFLLPVTWTDGWPVILPPGTPVPLIVEKPNLPTGNAPEVPTTGNIAFTDNFDSDTLAFRWIGLRAPTSQWWATSMTEKALFLEPRSDWLSGQGNPSYLAVRQQNNDFSCSVTLTAQPETVNCTAGLVAFQNETHFYAISVKVDAGLLTEISLEQPTGGFGRGGRGFGRGGAVIGRGGAAVGRGDTGGTQAGSQSAQTLPEKLTSIELKIEGACPVTRCFYKTNGGEYVQLGQDLQSSFLSTDTAGGFQGVTLGIFARN